MVSRSYKDLPEHLEELKRLGMVHTVDAPINKDSELHPLVRLQFAGGIPESQRKALLFTHVIDGKGRRYDMPVLVGAMAGNETIFATGLGVPLQEIAAKWDHAYAHPVPPLTVQDAVCQEVVHMGDDLLGPGKGLDALPIPISTPGFDSAPTLIATNVITVDPVTGVQNMGTYRAALKASDRLVVVDTPY
jgi:4-hydroxy-3-polyprenylbenzoate decarboxylase